jgi:aminoacyl tRNA synthase complex-interacting multifunctional protein 1
VEPLLVPEGVVNGERVMVDGYEGEAEAQLNPKKKVLESLFPDMMTSSGAKMFPYTLLGGRRS